MAQFDVFQNPIAAARRAYPWVVVLQSGFADASPERIVAPLVPRAVYPRVAGRLTPVVTVDGVDHVLLTASLAGVAVRDLGSPVDTLARSRLEILAAVDYLFCGV
jgi:toxin CcdB